MARQKKRYVSRVVDDVEFEKRLISIEVYNETDDMIESNTFDEDGQIILNEQRKVIEGRIVQHLVTDYDLKYERLITYKYEGSLLKEEKENLNDGSYFRTVYSYNNNDEIILIVKIDNNNIVIGKEEISYDNGAKIINFFDENNYLYRQEKLLFNIKNEIETKKITEYYLDNKNIEQEHEIIEKFEYDLLSNEMKNEIYHEDKLIYRETSEYIGGKLLAKSTIWSNETDVTSSLNYEYDRRSNLILEILEEDGKLINRIDFFYNTKDELIRIDDTKLEMDDYYVKYRESIVEEKQ